MKSLPKDRTRIQGKKQRLISMPLQALSSQLVSNLFIDFCIVQQVQHKSSKTVLLIRSKRIKKFNPAYQTCQWFETKLKRSCWSLQTSRKNRLKSWFFTIRTKHCFKTNESKRYSIQHTRGVLQKSIGYSSFRHLHRRNGVPL